MKAGRVNNPLSLVFAYAQEVRDLEANGYLFLFSSDINGVQHVKLKHAKNGRILMVSCSRDRYVIRENGIILKEVKLSA